MEFILTPAGVILPPPLNARNLNDISNALASTTQATVNTLPQSIQSLQTQVSAVQQQANNIEQTFSKISIVTAIGNGKSTSDFSIVLTATFPFVPKFIWIPGYVSLDNNGNPNMINGFVRYDGSSEYHSGTANPSIIPDMITTGTPTVDSWRSFYCIHMPSYYEEYAPVTKSADGKTYYIWQANNGDKNIYSPDFHAKDRKHYFFAFV